MLEHIKLRFKLLKDDVALVVVMLGMAIFLTMIFGQSFGESHPPTICFADMDGSEASAQLKSNVINAHEGYIYQESSVEEIKELIKNNSILAGIIVEEGFEEDYSKIRFVTSQDLVEVIQLKNVISQAISLLADKAALSEAIAQTVGTEDDLAAEAGKAFDDSYVNKSYTVSITTQGESEWAGYDDLMHYVLGFMLFFSTFPMTYVMADILREKKQHIFQRNLTTPINRASQLFAKMFVTFLLGFAQIAIILLAGRYLFSINWGDKIGILLAISACYTMTFTCLGLFLSSIVKSYDQLGALSPIILVSTAMLGGCMWPMELISNKVLLFLANITPQRWALSAMESIAMRDAAASTALVPVLVLLGMAAVYFLLGLRVMKKDLV